MKAWRMCVIYGKQINNLFRILSCSAIDLGAKPIVSGVEQNSLLGMSDAVLQHTVGAVS